MRKLLSIGALFWGGLCILYLASQLSDFIGLFWFKIQAENYIGAAEAIVTPLILGLITSYFLHWGFKGLKN